ncbi:MAG: phosphoribosyl-AMP cyclohydrolase, partial [Alkalimonas sp.]|nr:phosphoribosyl-AMP cyclohydrolase [Alkalimonas sp.]
MGTSQVMAASLVNNNITEAEVKQAQQAWGQALIAISSAYSNGGHEQAEKKARQVLDAAYGYSHGAVLFKPTLASGKQTFRTEYDGALAYFVGGNSAFADDSGFALKGWQGYEFKNAAVYINGDLAL